MSKVWSGVLAAASLIAAMAVPWAATAGTSKETSAWWAHVKVLAAADMQGRFTGSPGYQKAADYVAARFADYGLQPAGTDGYFQKIDFIAQTIDQDRSTAVLTLADGATAPDSDLLVVSATTEQPVQVTAPLVFVGYGLHLPGQGYDDFAGLDLKGKVAVLLRGGPASVPGPLRAYAGADELARTLEAAGAVGLITVTSPPRSESPWAKVRQSAQAPGLYLADPALRRYHAPFFLAQIDPARARLLFDGADQSLEALTVLAASGQPLPRFALKTRLEAHVAATTRPVSASNVVGLLPGVDPALSPQVVVVSAHLDHLGVGPPEPGGDGVFHGVMDNASGVASLLETARILKRRHEKPKRSILFLALCGEERGLLGSRYFVNHPSYGEGRLVADINTDMFLPLYPLRWLVAHGEAETSLGATARAAATQHGLSIVPDPEPNRMIFMRSDQYSFIRAGVPAMMFDLAPATAAEQRVHAAWLDERYHSQADDLDQPIDLAAADSYGDFLLDVILRVANARNAPTWEERSFFKP